ncbi:hypothetical protein [Brevibacillus panacihumi]|uniref:hypothetical protein n=1 Tax=Brevibacillus panacihumi TaxID=497735 RepID=UPI003D1B123E
MSNLFLALFLAALFLYRIYWGGGVSGNQTYISISTGLIVLNLVIFVEKWVKRQRRINH